MGSQRREGQPPKPTFVGATERTRTRPKGRPERTVRGTRAATKTWRTSLMIFRTTSPVNAKPRACPEKRAETLRPNLQNRRTNSPTDERFVGSWVNPSGALPSRVGGECAAGVDAPSAEARH